MCREGQDFKYDSEILLELGPQAASEQLQEAIRDRVESWGLSLPGGYWVPSLTVQTAADADQSVARLQRLLEGSGVVIRTEPLVVPPTRGNTKR
ncbi:MAG: 2'-5' RNA ligase family protein [Planctomycetaceae bacterium]|nr:2'-5' RNA ligase family protein [Planctomycetaceae bacterium]